MGKVISVNVSKAKGTIKTPVEKILIDVSGIRGDAHAGPWHRQVSMLAKESIDKFSEGSNRCFECGEFAENITTEGLDLHRVSILDRFRIGDAKLEVTQLGKKCHGDACAIFQEVGRCVMPKEGVFCRVISRGEVTSGDPIECEPYPLSIKIITLSDRASAGEYEDRSGPEIERMLHAFFENKPWHIDTDVKIIPDDPNALTEALLQARDTRVTAVFTTGGTGIGPRDRTPETVLTLADRTIPGIMEHIRIKFGADKPNALLSRSVAAVMNQTLVYALPGSVRAVAEYVPEILHTFEHSILMLHGIDAH